MIDSYTSLAGEHLNILSTSHKQDSQYWRFDPTQRPPVRESYPKPLSNWEGLPDNIDDALQYSNGYTYFFKVRLMQEEETSIIQSFTNCWLILNVHVYC